MCGNPENFTHIPLLNAGGKVARHNANRQQNGNVIKQIKIASNVISKCLAKSSTITNNITTKLFRGLSLCANQMHFNQVRKAPLCNIIIRPINLIGSNSPKCKFLLHFLFWYALKSVGKKVDWRERIKRQVLWGGMLWCYQTVWIIFID